MGQAAWYYAIYRKDSDWLMLLVRSFVVERVLIELTIGSLQVGMVLWVLSFFRC